VRHPVIVLDIHRDATTSSTPLGHGQAASILLVVARQNPWWQWNYTFARNLDARLASEAPGLSRGVRVLDGRYNQDLSPLALIVEIGGADSTLDECLISARVFAGVLADYVGGP
jgi:stage II sporulation protein P